MMKRISVFALAAGWMWAAFAPEGWLYRQKVEVAGAVTRVTLDRDFYGGGSLDALRVVKDGAEVPYLLRVAHATRSGGAVAVRVVNKETRGGSLYVTLEFTGKQVLHNQVNLVVSRPEFRSQVKIEGSDDGRVWGTVRQGAYVFQYKTDGGEAASYTTLRYPDSRRRYLRLTLLGWPDASEFTGATVWSDTSAEARRTEIWNVTRPSHETKNRTTCTVLETGSRAPRDTARVTVAAGRERFYRSVTVEHSLDGKAWGWAGAGAIYRVPGEESLAVTFAETQLPWQRLCVFQGDDEAVLLESVKLSGVDREVYFRSEGPGSYWLYSGADEARAPEYDLARTAGAEFWDAAQAGKLGTREANPAYRPPPEPVKPWTERFPGLLYGVMGVAVAGIGWMALRLLKT
jgi:hypothetical protein